MTQKELDATITYLIIVQEKPKSTGNSYRRKQWENRRNMASVYNGKNL